MKQILHLALIFILITSCKEAPTFITENELDPESENFIVPKPTEFNVHTSQGKNRLEWMLPRNQSNYIVGFLLYRSYSDSDSYQRIRTLEANARGDRYSAQDPFIPETFNTLYKIQSFYIKQSSDTVYSEPVFTDQSNIPSHQVSQIIKPFNTNPTYKIELNLWEDSSVTTNFYIENSDSSKSLINSISEGSSSIEYPLDVNLPTRRFFYKFLNDEYESRFLLVEEIQEIDLTLKKELTLKSITDNSVNLILSDLSFTDTSYFEQNQSFSEFDLLIMSSDSTVLFESTGFEFNSPIFLDGIDSLNQYDISIKGRKGIYESETKRFRLAYTPKMISEREYNFAFDGFNDIVTDIDSKNKLIYLSSSSSGESISSDFTIIDYERGRYESTFYQGEKKIGKFIPENFNSSSKLITSSDAPTLSIWDIDNLELSLSNNIPSYSNGLVASDFDFYSEDELFVLSKNVGIGSLRISKYNIEKETHELLFSINSVNTYLSRIFYDEFNNKIYAIFQKAPSSYVHSIVYDLNTKVLSNAIEHRVSAEAFNVELGAKGEYLHIYDDEDYVVTNTKTGTTYRNYSIDYPLDYRRINVAKSGLEVCSSIRKSDRNLPTAIIDCYIDSDRPLQYFHYTSINETSLLTSVLSDDANELILIFRNKFIAFTFEKKWNLYE
tara:strand:+ start:12006 stop:14003 length:1998 start_codon:yes stop_codon:yes gene_type:complete